MTDRELRALRDANTDDEVLRDIVNRIIMSRRNGQTAYAGRLEALALNRAQTARPAVSMGF